MALINKRFCSTLYKYGYQLYYISRCFEEEAAVGII